MRLSIAVVAGVIGLFIHSSRADDTTPAVAAPAEAPTPLAVESPKEGAGLESPETRPPELPAQGLQSDATNRVTGSGVRQPPDDSASSELLSRKEAELECLQEEVDRLREQTGQARAVTVRLVAFELSRARLGNRADELDALLGLRAGLSSLSRESSPFPKAGESPEGASAVVRPAAFERAEPPLRSPGVSLVDGGVCQTPLFKRLCDAGLINVLAEPTLTSTNARPASFLVGGQFPVPVQGSNGASRVIMQPFGLQLEFVPAVRPGRRIRLDLVFELSDRDFTKTVEIAGIRVPGLVSRCVNTQIELKSGQTAVISRLSRRRLPISGVETEAEGRAESREMQSDDRELIVLVTPELLHDRDAPAPMRLRPPVAPDAEAAPSAYHPSEEYQYYPAMPVLPRGLQR